MPRRKARITHAEVKNIVSGAIAAGLPVAGLRFDEGGLSILTSASGARSETISPNEIDRLLDEAENGTGKVTLLRRSPR